MSSDPDFVRYVLEQLARFKPSARKMFGEYGLYAEGKFIALICDDIVFLKPTDEGSEMLEDVKLGYPYPGAKLWFDISEQLDDQDALEAVMRVTLDALPLPSPKKEKKIG